MIKLSTFVLQLREKVIHCKHGIKQQSQWQKNGNNEQIYKTHKAMVTTTILRLFECLLKITKVTVT